MLRGLTIPSRKRDFFGLHPKKLFRPHGGRKQLCSAPTAEPKKSDRQIFSGGTKKTAILTFVKRDLHGKMELVESSTETQRRIRRRLFAFLPPSLGARVRSIYSSPRASSCL